MVGEIGAGVILGRSGLDVIDADNATVSFLAEAGLVATVALARNHNTAEAGLLVGLLATCALVTRLLLRDLRAHPANFPEPSPSQGLRIRRP